MLAGQRRSFVVRTHDAWGNACDRGGARLALSVPDPVACEVTDMGDGKYEVEWQASVSGVYLVSVMLDGEHIADSPWPARSIALTSGSGSRW